MEKKKRKSKQNTIDELRERIAEMQKEIYILIDNKDPLEVAGIKMRYNHLRFIEWMILGPTLRPFNWTVNVKEGQVSRNDYI